MIIWKLELQLSVQSVPIATKLVSLDPAHELVNLVNILIMVPDLCSFIYKKKKKAKL